jgi:hypothetical protein
MKIRIRSLIVFLLFFLIIGCSNKTSVFLDEPECIQPCWRGITIGQSKGTVTKELDEMEDIESGSFIWAPSNSLDIEEDVSWKFINKKEYGGSLSFINQKVINLGFSYDDEYSLGDFIEKFGEPSFVLIHSTISGRRAYSQTYFLFSEKGICLTHDTDISSESLIYFIDSTKKIKYVILSDIKSDPYQLKYGCLQGFDEVDFQMNVHNWKGFGEYSVFQQK